MQATDLQNPALQDQGRKTLKASAGCPICGGKMNYRYTISRFSPAFDIERCVECGLERQVSMPEKIEDLYTEDYYSGKSEYGYKDERKQETFERYVWRARLRRIREFVPAPADFLDVGCAYGGLALEAQAMGYRSQGLDISEHAVREASARGLEAHKGRITDGIFRSSSVDVVTLIEVIEHLEDPRAAVQELARIMRPGGLAVIQTANFAGRQAVTQGSAYHYYLPGHLHYFSRANLTRLLGEEGFSRVVFFPGVEFGLLPKILKSRGSFKKASDYLKWLRIAAYHMKSKIAFGDYASTSAMVLYAIRDSKS